MKEVDEIDREAAIASHRHDELLKTLDERMAQVARV